MVPVLAKLPLGLLVPNFTKDIPNDFPFKPFWRDAFITSLSVICRGEFNVVVASFGLSESLLDADVYSAIVMAILISSIVGPLLLSQTIRHYNQLSDGYFSKPHLVERIKNSRDGTRPLFFAIQIRAPALTVGLHEKFQNVLQNLGLMVLDHRTWHTTGLEAVAMSEIFVRDTLQTITVKNCFDDDDAGSDISTSSSDGSHKNQKKTQLEDTGAKVLEIDDCFEVSIGETIANKSSSHIPAGSEEKGHTAIEKRLAQVQTALQACLGDVEPGKFIIQTKQWEPFLQNIGKGHNLQNTYSFQEAGAANSDESYRKKHQRQPTYTFQGTSSHDPSTGEHPSSQTTNVYQDNNLADNQSVSRGHQRQPTYTFAPQDEAKNSTGIERRHRRRPTGTFQGEACTPQRSLYDIPSIYFEDIVSYDKAGIPVVVDLTNTTTSVHEVNINNSSFLEYLKKGDMGEDGSEQEKSCQVTSDYQSDELPPNRRHHRETSLSSKSYTSAAAALSQRGASLVNKKHSRRSLSMDLGAVKAIKSRKNHRRTVTHGQLDSSTLAEAETLKDHGIPAGHRRRRTSGQCYGLLIGEDLWETDQVTRDCLVSSGAANRSCDFRASGSLNARGDAQSTSTSLAGSLCDSLQYHSSNESDESGNGFPASSSDQQFISLLRASHDQPTGVQQHLQGYIRHCRAEF